jgi:hypothetical protein
MRPWILVAWSLLLIAVAPVLAVQPQLGARRTAERC